MGDWSATSGFDCDGSPRSGYELRMTIQQIVGIQHSTVTLRQLAAYESRPDEA